MGATLVSYDLQRGSLASRPGLLVRDAFLVQNYDPGTILTPNDLEVLVATGRGALRLEEVQLEGKRRMSAADFLRGFSSTRPRF